MSLGLGQCRPNHVIGHVASGKCFRQRSLPRLALGPTMASSPVMVEERKSPHRFRRYFRKLGNLHEPTASQQRFEAQLWKLASSCPEKHVVQLGNREYGGLPNDTSLSRGVRLTVVPEPRHFELTDKLGQGGAATVYHARHLPTARELAIKVVREVAKKDLVEIEILRSLFHANIVDYYGFCTKKRSLWVWTLCTSPTD